MGSGSSRLICPKDYDEKNFKKILMLYDKLDKNGDHTVDESELGGISELHVKNQLVKLENMKQPLINNKRQEILKFESELEMKIKKLREDVDLMKTQLNNNTAHQLKIIEDDINNLNKLSIEERNAKFKNAITDSKDQIEFWKFFQYMKTRTDDIPNISF
jgi:hypothetical protein